VGLLLNRVLSGRTPANRPSRRIIDLGPDGGIIESRGEETSDELPGLAAEEPQVRVRGVIRSDVVHLLPPYGTAYGLLDERTASYDCVLKSDVHMLGDRVGDYVEVTGPLTMTDQGLPVMRVTRLQLLAAKWMR